MLSVCAAQIRNRLLQRKYSHALRTKLHAHTHTHALQQQQKIQKQLKNKITSDKTQFRQFSSDHTTALIAQSSNVYDRTPRRARTVLAEINKKKNKKYSDTATKKIIYNTNPRERENEFLVLKINTIFFRSF